MSSSVVTPPKRRESEPSGLAAWAQRLDTPTTTYYLLIGVTSVLVLFGLVMVLSASMVTALAESKSSSAYGIFISQAVFATIGAVGLVVASRLPVMWWKRLALPVLGGAMLLQTLVFFVGVSVNGNKNWLAIGPITVQPSEMVKLGLVLTGALILTAKLKLLNQWKHIVFPFLAPIAFVALTLVMLGHDLGTVIILAGIVGGLMFAAGVPGRYFAIALAFIAAGATTMVLISPNRLGRFDVWLGKVDDPFGVGRQPLHARFALADGGWFGLGLGASREKWGGLSESHNDFIFAIIGEELGLPGTLMILALFGLLAYACFRLVTRTKDTFVRLAAAGVMSWIVIQALVNIGSVIGLLPVIGVPLPLVSSGGSSLITTMAALGMLIAFSREEPGCRKALAAKSKVVRRSYAVLPAKGARRSSR